MRLDRNVNEDGKGKYALLKLRRQHQPISAECMAAADLLKQSGLLDFGDTPDTEFFVIRLKDKYSPVALFAYAASAFPEDPEYSSEVLELAKRAQDHPNRRRPD